MRTKGWKQVLGFTYIQNLKSKSFKGSTIMMCVIIVLICVGINLIPSMFSDDDIASFFGNGEINEYKIETLYLLDESGLSAPADFAKFSEYGIEISPITADEFETTVSKVAATAQAEALLRVEKAEDGDLNAIVYRPDSEEIVTGNECSAIADEAQYLLKKALFVSYGVAEEDFEALQVGVSSEIRLASGFDKSVFQNIVAVIVPMFSAVIMFSFIITYSQIIAQSIATEKTSRVMELLLTSVKPLAVVIGKVVGMLLLSITQLAIFGFVGGAAFLASSLFGFLPSTISAVTNAASSAIESGAAEQGGEIASQVFSEIGTAFPGLNVVSIIEIFLVFVLGFIFYALLAALVGASVSRSEDLAQAQQPLMLVSMAGFFLAYLPAIGSMDFNGEENPVLTLARYLPISSPFALPSGILLGDFSQLQIVVSIAALIVFVVLTALLVAKVYHHIVLHSGDYLRMKDIFKFAKIK